MARVGEKQNDFNEKTRVLFSKLYKRKITEEEAEEIKSNFFKLIEVLKTINMN